jgi:Cation transporter/ATPase, N-terminus
MPAVNQQFVSRAVGASSAADDLEYMPVAQVLAHFAVKPDRVLSRPRRARYGPNALVEKERSLAAKLLGHFTGPIAYMIEAAAIVSAVIGRWDDFAIIAGLLFRADRASGDARAAIGGKSGVNLALSVPRLVRHARTGT